MTNLTTMVKRAVDPSRLGYPPTLATEIALRQQPVKDICAAYGITLEQWKVICEDPIFVKELETAVNELKKDGMSFRVKARLQSEALLERSWEMIHADHDAVPPSVQADLLKFTVRAAGLDGSKDQAAGAGLGTALQININLG
jgi:hypothetical protein